MKPRKILCIFIAAVMSLGFALQASAATTFTYMFSKADFRYVYQGYSSTHTAVDIKSSTSTSINGATINAVFEGKVLYKYTWNPNISNTDINSAGNYVVIQKTGSDYRAGFMHMTSPCPLALNTSVGVTTVLGTVGLTGNTTGYHLHHDIFTSGNWSDQNNSYDPCDFYNEI